MLRCLVAVAVLQREGETGAIKRRGFDRVLLQCVVALLRCVVAVRCCGVLLRCIVAVCCCSVLLQCSVAVCCSERKRSRLCVVVLCYCSVIYVLQCIISVGCCSVLLECVVAVRWCSVLQREGETRAIKGTGLNSVLLQCVVAVLQCVVAVYCCSIQLQCEVQREGDSDGKKRARETQHNYALSLANETYKHIAFLPKHLAHKKALYTHKKAVYTHKKAHVCVCRALSQKSDAFVVLFCRALLTHCIHHKACVRLTHN